MKTIVGLFEDWSTARQVLEELARAGFDRDDINLVANDANKTYAQSLGDGNGNSHGSGARTAEGAASGALAGGALGGIGGKAKFADFKIGENRALQQRGVCGVAQHGAGKP